MKIHLYDHPFESLPPKIFDYPSIGQWLIKHYGITPQTTLSIYKGEPSQETDITGNIDALIANDEDYYTILEAPGDAGVLTFLYYVAVVFSVASQLSQNTKMPPNINRTQESPNNLLGERSNQARVHQRIEDIYGTVQSVPSLMMPTWTYYDALGNKFERGYYCVGRGYYELTKIKDGDTLIENIPGAKLSVWAPFTAPDGNTAHAQLNIGGGIAEPVDTRIKNVNIDGIILKSPNQATLDGRHGYAFYGNKIVQANENPGFTTVFVVGQTISVTMEYDYGNGDLGGFWYYIPLGSDMAPQSSSPGPSGWPVYPYKDASGNYKWEASYDANATAKTVTIHDVTSGDVSLDNIIVGDILRGVFNGTDYRGKITAVSGSGSTRTFTLDTAIPNATNQLCTFGIYVNYSGTYTIASIEFEHNGNSEWLGSGAGSYSTITLTTSPFSRPIPIRYPGAGFGYCDEYWQLINGEWNYTNMFINAIVTSTTPVSNFTEWLFLENPLQTKLLFNLSSTNGIYKDAGGGPISIAIDTEFEIQRLVSGVPTGTVFTATLTEHSKSGNESTGASLLYDLLGTAGFSGPCQVRARRTTDHDFSFQGSVVDEVQWEGVYSVIPNTLTHFGNKTTMQSEMQLNQRALSIRGRQLTALAARKVPTYNGTSWSATFNNDGSVASGTLHTSSKIVDIIGALAADPRIGSLSLSEDVDIDQIYSIQQQLDTWHADAGTFNYTFDSADISFEETINMVANAAFCAAYRQNGKIRLALDTVKTTSTALFCHRNKKPDSETVTRTFFNGSDYDAIEMVYTDPDTNATESFIIPLDGNYTKPQKIEIAGIRSFPQAWFRANRELAKLEGQRVTLDTSTTMDARALLPFERVDIVDDTRFKSYAGEVVGQSGLTLTLSNDVVFKDGQTHSIVLMKRDGSLQAISCTPGTTQNSVVLSTTSAEAIKTTSDAAGVRTIYSFAADNDRPGLAYSIQTVGFDDKYAKVNAVIYSDDFYAADFEAVPDKGGIINYNT
ncbi:MAG: host specificity factor TipJ family phage tail protein [Pseudomonadota bacterium]